ncbi:MAG: hypothetical protein K8H88_26325 [Sandaracinaceae bacterium]|nr:hypothetical protein [Sandaracinaceae bacterium]
MFEWIRKRFAADERFPTFDAATASVARLVATNGRAVRRRVIGVVVDTGGTARPDVELEPIRGMVLSVARVRIDFQDAAELHVAEALTARHRELHGVSPTHDVHFREEGLPEHRFAGRRAQPSADYCILRVAESWSGSSADDRSVTRVRAVVLSERISFARRCAQHPNWAQVWQQWTKDPVVAAGYEWER